MATYIDSSGGGIAGQTVGASPVDTGGGGGISDLLGNNNIAGLVGAGAGLIPGLLGANQPLPFQNNLQGIVNQIGQVGGQAGAQQQTLSGIGSELINPLVTGQLPGGANDVVNQIVQKQTADTKAKYASLGQTGSTMEQSALNDINTNKGALTFQIAQQMAQTGLQASSQSLQALGIELGANNAQASIYENMMKAQMTNNSNIFSSIGNFTSALAKALPAVAAAA